MLEEIVTEYGAVELIGPRSLSSTHVQDVCLDKDNQNWELRAMFEGISKVPLANLEQEESKAEIASAALPASKIPMTSNSLIDNPASRASSLSSSVEIEELIDLDGSSALEMKEQIDRRLIESFVRIDATVSMHLRYGESKELLDSILEQYRMAGWYLRLCPSFQPRAILLQFQAGSPANSEKSEWLSPNCALYRRNNNHRASDEQKLDSLGSIFYLLGQQLDSSHDLIDREQRENELMFLLLGDLADKMSDCDRIS